MAGLAVFDLDGTLVTRDSFLAFLLSYGRRYRRYLALALLPFDVSLYVARLISTRTLKQRVLRRFFKGQSWERIHDHARWFCEHWAATHLHPVGLQRLREHQQAGDRIILLTASPSLYVREVGRYLGINEVVCTEVRDTPGVCSGEIDGPNCKGADKVVKLTQYLGGAEAPPASYAYGDSKSDLPVLRWARHGFLVRKDGCREVTRGEERVAVGGSVT
jgi:phosphatidylglycerophosphatase C